VPIFCVSARQLASRCENKVQGGGGGLLASSCTYGTPPTRVGFEFIPHFVTTGMYYTEIENGQSSTTTHNIISTTRQFMVVIPRRCHGHRVKDVHPATRRCVRRALLSFPKVPSFCSLESPSSDQLATASGYRFRNDCESLPRTR